MNWARENIGKVISFVAILCTIIGFIGGVWATHESLKKDVETIKTDLWWIKQAISHTQLGE